LQREKNSQPRRRLPIEVSELRKATHLWFRLVQKAHFSKEWSALSKNEPIPNSSALEALKPMLGEDTLLRFGRWLQNAALEKHPIILPKHRISELLIDCAHRATLHRSTQLTLCHLRQKYWIIGSRNLVKAHIRRCVICAHQSAKASTQLMGNLPESCVNPSPPFSHRRGLRRTVQNHTVRRTWPEDSETLCSVTCVSCHQNDSFRNCGRLYHYRVSSSFP